MPPLVHIEVLINTVAYLNEVGVFFSTVQVQNGWTYGEVRTIGSAVKRSIMSLEEILGDRELAKSAFRDILGIRDKQFIVLERGTTNGNLGGQNYPNYIVIYDPAFDAWDPRSIVIHEFSHNTTRKFFRDNFNGVLIINCKEFVSDQNNDLLEYYRNNMALRYTVTREHRLELPRTEIGENNPCYPYYINRDDPNAVTSIFEVKVNDGFEFRDYNQGFSSPVKSLNSEGNYDWSELLADALAAHLIKAYDDNSGDCYDRLAASIRREQGEILFETLLTYFGYIDPSECDE